MTWSGVYRLLTWLTSCVRIVDNMHNGDEWLERLAEELRERIEKGTAPTNERLTIRDLLSQYGFKRRGTWISGHIRNQLDRLGLRTVPDFERNWIGAEIDIEIEPESTSYKDRPDPTLRVNMLEAANNKPLSVKPDTSLTEAITLMIAKDYSQLPVMQNERNVKGIVSWKSIGYRRSFGQDSNDVRDYVDPVTVIPKDTTLFEAIGIVERNDYVLVQDSDNTISGIVTASDLTNQFEQIAGPFLLVGEVEGHLRNLVHGKFTTEQMNDVAGGAADGTAREINGAADLTLGDYCQLFERAELWGHLNLAVDQKGFVKCLHTVREIRNGIMHFSPDGQPEEYYGKIMELVRLFRTLSNLGAM